ncbi:MAG TPA: hydrogenase expression/formation protein HypE [Pseudomonadales bacterium]|nr:hydrogenase expression/formation protein HypE [Pseudomonadales bacterium]
MKQDRYITLAHGNGGRLMRELIDATIAARLGSPLLDTRLDAADVPVERDGTLVMTTDGFTVQPLEFPGGSIGSLAIHGTVNDLAVSGAEPRFLSMNAFIEDGTELALLERLISDMAQAARHCGVNIVTGDTKVVGRGECGGIYFATTGIGVRADDIHLGIDRIRPGDAILVTGPVGDHGAAIMLAREEFGLSGDLTSDAASVLPAARLLLGAGGVRFMRDPTRGGLATVANELARVTGLGIHLSEAAIPIRDPVNAVCEVLGLEPLYLACEGRIVAVVDPDHASAAIAALAGSYPEAAIIGHVEGAPGPVVMETLLGGERVLDELEDDPLPRIC